jgi:Family of unknown function (DUF6221)
MEELAAFNAARLDEEEAAAKGWIFRGTVVMLTEGEPVQADAEYLATFSGARVLREVQAKRVILGEHQPEPWGRPHPELLRCNQGHDDTGYWTPWPCAEVRAITAVWSDHPDYQKEWAP